MGDSNLYQPLTKEDKITVVLYRTGIAISTLLIVLSALSGVKYIYAGITDQPVIMPAYTVASMLLTLYLGVGLSVFFIHLYVGKFHKILKKIYYVAIACLALMYIMGEGNPALPLFRNPPYGALLLMPLSLCLSFITAKEAFCFRLVEGYILAVIMPAYLFLFSFGVIKERNAVYGFAFIAVLLVLFAFRKVFMPLHYDIGDKSAYQP